MTQAGESSIRSTEREGMKEVYGYNELGTIIEQGLKTVFTRPALLRVSVVKPSDKSHTIKVSVNLLIGDCSIGVLERKYKNILDMLVAFDINYNEEIWEVLECRQVRP